MKTDLKAGLILTIAGTAASGWFGDGAVASSACLNEPKSLTLDAKGNLFSAASENHVVRKVDRTTSCITTIAGRIQAFDAGATPVPPASTGGEVDEDPLAAETSKVDLHAVTQ